MLTLSPAASEAIALVLAELNAAALHRRGEVSITLHADVECVKGQVLPLVCAADFDGCRPSLVGLVDVEPRADGDARTYATLNGEFMVTFPD